MSVDGLDITHNKKSNTVGPTGAHIWERRGTPRCRQSMSKRKVPASTPLPTHAHVNETEPNPEWTGTSLGGSATESLERTPDEVDCGDCDHDHGHDHDRSVVVWQYDVGDVSYFLLLLVYISCVGE